MLRRNSALEVARYLPGVLLIGSNEGETALGYKIDASGGIPLAVPFGDLSADAIAWVGPTLGSLISRVISSDVDLDEICYPDSGKT